MLLTALVCLTASFSAAAAPALADRHVTRGAKCESCHPSAPPKASDVTDAQCFVCHGDYAKVAARTEKKDINPHESHQGEVPCMRCHSGHKQSRMFCNDCHEFNVKVP